MQRSIPHRIFLTRLVFSLFLHLLFLLSIAFNLSTPKQQLLPHLYTPAYVYTGSITPQLAKATKLLPHTGSITNSSHVSQPFKKSTTLATKKKSILDISKEVLQNNQIQTAMANAKNSEPILLVGDQNKPADPLIRLIGRSLSAYFRYPSMEGNFGLHGKVIIGLILHPEGYFSDVEILQSSNNPNFDAAALYAVNKAPTVKGAERFLREPKYFVIGFIFD